MDDDKILVSIKCLVYNHEPYLRQCLEGFVMQKTNFRFEVVVHDDASTDGSAAIIREYAEKYPDIIKPIYETENQYSKHDGSLSRIVNAALRGKYVAMCEGDDYWIDPMKLQKQVDFLEAHTDYSMCFHRAIIKNEINKSDLNIKCSTVEDRDYTGDELLKTWTVPTASMMFRREVLDYKNIFDKRILYGDIILILRCAEYGKVRGSSLEMSVYRIQKNSATNDPTLNKYRIEATPQLYVFIKETFSCVKRSTLRKLYSYSCFEVFKLNKDFRALFESVINSPLTVLSRIFNWMKRKIFRK